MKNCQTCGSDRILSAKCRCSDINIYNYKNKEIELYESLPVIGNNSNLDIKYCLSCGQIQGTFPVKLKEFLS